MGGARGCADGNRAVYGDGERSARSHWRVQAVRGAGVPDHDRPVGGTTPVTHFQLTRIDVSVVFGLAVAITACTASPSVSPSSSASASSQKVVTLDLTYDQPAVVGASAQATLSGLPSGKTVDLSWGTVTGGWEIENYYYFRGKKYSETTTSLGKYQIDANGRLSAPFIIPEDYGGVHEVIALIDGQPVAQNAINLTPSFSITPTSGPVGTAIELKVAGLGRRTMAITWVV